MAVKVRERNGAWWLYVDFKGIRKARRVGTGQAGKRAAQVAAEQIQAKLALGDLSLLQGDKKALPTFREAAEQWRVTYGQLGQLRRSTQALYKRTLET